VSLSGLRPDQIAAATGLNNFLRISAGAFATSLATTLWESRATLHHAQLVEHVTRMDPAAVDALNKLGASGLSTEQAYGFLNQLINQQAFTLAALDLFQASAILLMFLVPLVWLARPTKQPSGAQATSAAH